MKSLIAASALVATLLASIATANKLHINGFAVSLDPETLAWSNMIIAMTIDDENTDKRYDFICVEELQEGDADILVSDPLNTKGIRDI